MTTKEELLKELQEAKENLESADRMTASYRDAYGEQYKTIQTYIRQLEKCNKEKNKILKEKNKILKEKNELKLSDAFEFDTSDTPRSLEYSDEYITLDDDTSKSKKKPAGSGISAIKALRKKGGNRKTRKNNKSQRMKKQTRMMRKNNKSRRMKKQKMRKTRKQPKSRKNKRR